MILTKFEVSDRVFSIILILTCVMVFNHAFFADFILIDDDLNIYKNPFFKKITLETFIEIWKSPYENLYIPVTYCLWGILVIISELLTGKITPFVFHAVNIIVHSFNAAIIFNILKLICKKAAISNYIDKNEAAFAGAMLFAIHPIQVEAVAWISGMKDILFTFWGLISLYLFISSESEEAHNRVNIKKILAFIFFMASVLSKPTAVILPFIISIIMLTALEKPLKSLLQLVPWFFCSAMAVFSSKLFMPPPPVDNLVIFWQKPFLAMDVVLFYLKKILWPYIILNDYGRTPELIVSKAYIYFQPAIVAILLFFFRKIKNFRLWAGLFIAFFVSILPYSGIVAFEFQRISAVADRYSYFGVFVFSIFVSCLVLKTRIAKKYFHIVLFIFFILMSLKTINQTKVWHDDITLGEHTVMFNPSSGLSYVNMGIKNASMGMFDEAVANYKKALLIDHDNELAYYNMGIALAASGDFDGAYRLARELYRLKPYRGRELQIAIEVIQKTIDSSR